MGTRGFQEEAKSTATELERCRQEWSLENGHQLGWGWRGCGGQEELEELCRPMCLTRDEPGTHVGRELVLGVMLLSQWGRVPALANFRGSLSLCLHPSIQNDQIRRGNTHWEGACFRSSQPCHLSEWGMAPVRLSFWGSHLLMPTRFDLERPSWAW